MTDRGKDRQRRGSRHQRPLSRFAPPPPAEAIRGGRSTSARRRVPASESAAVNEAILRSAADLLEQADPLPAEIWASATLGMWALREDLSRAEGAASAFIAYAARRATPEASAALAAIAGVADEPLSGRAAASLRGLEGDGVAPPPWSQAIGRVEHAGAFLGTDLYGDQDVYVLVFQAGPLRHGLVLTADHNHQTIRDAFVTRDPLGYLSRYDAAADTSVSPVDAGRARGSIEWFFAAGRPARVSGLWSRDLRRSRALLRARLRLLPEPATSPSRRPLPDDDRERLIWDFLASNPRLRTPEAEVVADAVLEALCSSGDGDPLRVSPAVVEILMSERLVRSALLTSEESEVAPEVIRAWITFAGARRGLPNRLVVETSNVVALFEDDLVGALGGAGSIGAGSIGAPIAEALESDGIDPADEEAVMRWMAEIADAIEREEPPAIRIDPT